MPGGFTNFRYREHMFPTNSFRKGFDTAVAQHGEPRGTGWPFETPETTDDAIHGDRLSRSTETSAPGSPKERQSLFTSLSRAAYSPFSSNSSNGPIVELLKDRDFIVEDVSLAREGSELVSVKWKFRPSLPRAVGEWVFDTAKSWALVSHKSRAQLADGKGLPVENIITIEYEGLAGDVPLVKSYESVNKFTETGEIADREYTTVSEIVSSNTGREQFTLASYGLSYGQGVPENRTGKWLVIVGMIGIGSVLMGRWIFRRWRTAV